MCRAADCIVTAKAGAMAKAIEPGAWVRLEYQIELSDLFYGLSSNFGRSSAETYHGACSAQKMFA